MTPDYDLAAKKAADTLCKYKTADTLTVLKQLPNVLAISYTAKSEDDTIVRHPLDAITMMNKSGNETRYIVLYNQNTSAVKLRFALARELGHIILKHDDSCPGEIRDEEASSFAHYFLCPLLNPVKKIQYRPKHEGLLWELKSIRVFDSVDHLKAYVVEEGNKFNRFIGKPSEYKAKDVKLSERSYFDTVAGWKNCREVVLDGKTVGYCGE